MSLEFRFLHDWQLGPGYFLGIIDHGYSDGKPRLAQPIQFKEIPPGDVFAEIPKALPLDQKEAESLMDALWRAGIRPTRCADSEKGQLEAVRDHLKDMRQIAFSAAKIVPPEYAGPMIARGEQP